MLDYGAAAAELRGVADVGLLYPAEAACCTQFAPKRIADFAGGRLCARQALSELGIVDFPLTVNADRTPRWPPDIVGSISHTAAFCCAAVARAAEARSIGIDAEIAGGVTPELDHLLFTPSETAFLASLSGEHRRLAATLFFSAKEAFYKCQFPVTRAWLDFPDAAIVPLTSDWTGGSFRIETDYHRLGLDRVADVPLYGRFLIDGDLIVSAVALRQGEQAAIAVNSPPSDAARARNIR